MKYILNLLVVWVAIGLTYGQPVSKAQKGTFALTNATIETVTKGQVSGNLIISEGKISALGPNAPIPAGATEIDCKGMTIYPGMIDGGTQLGLVEVSSVSLTRDNSELGDVIPQMQALTAVNPNSVAIPVTRVSGVTTVISAPSGGLMPGTAALINLVGYTPNQMFAGFKGVVLNFPSSRKSRWDRRSDEEVKKAYEKAVKNLNETWENAQLYAKVAAAAQKDAKVEVPYNPEMAALLPVVKGEAPFLISVYRAKDIEEAIKWVEKNKVKAIFTGVAEGWRVADKLAAANIPVIVGPVLSTPTRSSDRYDRPYANAGILAKAGVKVAIRTNDTENVRNLPYNAGFAATYGMGKEAALKAVTINPAEIFGVADQLGSLEVGKKANLFIADGDPFETKTQVKAVFIDGWQIPMDSRHIRLYNEFLERSPGLKK